jgi:hypothetical protein
VPFAASRRGAWQLRGLVVLGVLAALAAPPPALAAADPRLADLRVAVVDGSYLVDFNLVGAFGEDVQEQIDAGLPVTFRFRVEVLRKRALWDHTLLEQELDVTVNFDSLTKQYRLTRTVDGTLVDSMVSEKTEEMQRWMTEVRAWKLDPLPGDKPLEGQLFVRARGRLSPGFVLFFFPYTSGTGWARVPLPPIPPAPPDGD